MSSGRNCLRALPVASAAALSSFRARFFNLSFTSPVKCIIKFEHVCSVQANHEGLLVKLPVCILNRFRASELVHISTRGGLTITGDWVVTSSCREARIGSMFT